MATFMSEPFVRTFEQYTHSLIPDRVDFAPHPQQVVAFCDGLTKLGGAPLQSALRVGKLSGQFRTGWNPLTGTKSQIPRRDYSRLKDISEISEQLKGLDDYILAMSGKGPPRIPPFSLYNVTDLEKPQSSEPTDYEFRGTYSLEVRCCLHAEAVATSNWHDETSIPREAPFGDPCPAKDRTGSFHHPCTGAIIRVPKAGCARFWIEFEFGKWLLPRIYDDLNLLTPAIVDCAEECFGTSFVQGCRW